MQKLFDEVSSLDERCYGEFALSEDILMEHAANGIAGYIRDHFAFGSKIILACGSANNGADGLAAARLLHGDYDVCIFHIKEPKSKMALLQERRNKALGVSTCRELVDCDVLVDAFVGTGFEGEFSEELSAIMKKMNALKAFKIACDVPSGLRANGECAGETFVADVSLTMGALKKSMFLDEAKDFVGEIKVIDLGISREIYETKSDWNLLDMDDLKLPYRRAKNSHKGSFGHLALACGNKAGASIMSAKTALRFGAGLVTLVGFEDEIIPQSIMYSHELPANTTALALGMGLGDEFSDLELETFLDNWLPLVADADIFHMPILREILERKNIVLTPHAKEFTALLKQTEIANISVDTLQKNRFRYVEEFCLRFPHATLLLKGANVIIAKGDEFFINPHGTSVLAKGGSGDVLSGLIGALLAQGYEPLEAAKNASLAHARLALDFEGADFSLTPDDLIEGICKL
ncbi:NAD(P)H-hydrate dehydratase [bacterium]|nr:NAD(P)H-hydrate dehydratase [bacterium]MBU1990553.1 NAD(P)H-hydrate dehydratase [bacterium]